MESNVFKICDSIWNFTRKDTPSPTSKLQLDWRKKLLENLIEQPIPTHLLSGCYLTLTTPHPLHYPIKNIFCSPEKCFILKIQVPKPKLTDSIWFQPPWQWCYQNKFQQLESYRNQGKLKQNLAVFKFNQKEMDFNFEIICPYSSMSGYYFQSLLQLFCTHTNKKIQKMGEGRCCRNLLKKTFSFPCLGYS